MCLVAVAMVTIMTIADRGHPLQQNGIELINVRDVASSVVD
jgi:hypothetical protein